MCSLRIEPAAVACRIEQFIRAQVLAYRRDGAALGLSGGIDSALVATLAARALGPEGVLALLLPERDSSAESTTDAMLVVEQLGLRYRVVELTPMLADLGLYKVVPLRMLGTRAIKSAVVRQQHEQQLQAVGERPFLSGLLGTHGIARQQTVDAGQAYARAKHRMRMLTLYFHAELGNRLVLGTTNRSESMTGFVVKWGDNVADVEPILPLYKTQVRQLAEHLQMPRPIMDKQPTPDLVPGITDEYALGLPYEQLDQVLWALERQQKAEAIARDVGIDLDLVLYVTELVRRSAHLRTLPPAPAL